MNEPEVASILKKASEKCRFDRSKFIQVDIPTTIDNVTVMVFFGDIRSMFILSAILLKRYREEVKGSKYFILCTWPGYEVLFPWVNEYWGIHDVAVFKSCFSVASSFNNDSSYALQFRKGLNHWFNDVVGVEELETYYNNGIKQEFWDRFKHVKRYLPSVSSSAILGPLFNKEIIKKSGYKVFISPSELIQKWHYDKIVNIKVARLFWKELVKELINSGITPVLHIGVNGYDISSDFLDKCIYLKDYDISKVLAAMRATGCVLDIFSGISRLAVAARTPYMYIDERVRHSGQKENEIEGLCCEKGLLREYIYSFPDVIVNGDISTWKTSLFDLILSKLFKFLPILNRDTWPSPVESLEIVLYENVKQANLKKFGIQFMKVNKDIRNRR
jgi:hypothetical protein